MIVSDAFPFVRIEEARFVLYSFDSHYVIYILLFHLLIFHVGVYVSVVTSLCDKFNLFYDSIERDVMIVAKRLF